MLHSAGSVLNYLEVVTLLQGTLVIFSDTGVITIVIYVIALTRKGFFITTVLLKFNCKKIKQTNLIKLSLR